MIVRNDTSRFRVVCKGFNPKLVKAETEAKDGAVAEDVTNIWGKTKAKGQEVEDVTVGGISGSKLNVGGISGSSLNAGVGWLAREIEGTIRINPTIPLKSLQDMIQKKFQVEVTVMQMFRARSQATKRVQGDYNVQYTMLRDYCEELLRANPGTTIKIEIAGRNLLGLDGCLMKGPYPGQVLTAVGIDANNGIYPVAYALVESESKASWTWFLMCLGDDLGLDPNSYFTFISDRQKGIIPAIEKVYPKVEHRFYLRHIHENMKPRWKGDVYKDLLWSCASVLTTRCWENAMKAVEEKDKDLHDWLKEIPPRHWSRSHFSGRAKCDVLLNNLCEVFNRQLVYGRDKPIITCLEFSREYLMKKVVVVKKLIAKCNGPLTPAATRIFDAIKFEASKYTCIWTGGTKYQVSHGLDQRVVNLGERTCSCRKWDLIGMPCKHAMAAIWNQGLHGGGEPIPERWVDQAY
ncbi:uncharacterized protein LOC110888374 [Helianthus annuus]|uniref:uncharacterized protein LOC110888374 n=1 Tax=Helianthus annuus TaxID=4232 RepID=UPI000B8F0DB9|nr:uncharacterized protein LOC110888374 [Helianthus annuus]